MVRDRAGALRIIGLAGGVIGLAAVTYTLVTQITAPGPINLDAIYIFAGLGSLVVGALLINHQPRNVIGWLLLAHGLIWTITETARAYMWTSYEFGPQTLDELAIWLVAWMGPAGWLLVPLLVAYFPTGRVATPWLRWPVRIGATILAMFMLVGMLVPGTLNDVAHYLDGQIQAWGIQGLAGLQESEAVTAVIDVLNVYSLILALTIVVDVIRRWRRSVDTERLQMRWFGLGVLATMVLLGIASVISRVNVEYTLVERFFTASAIGAVPVSIGIAASRYRLYEIDRLVSRTVTYTVVGGLTAAVYATAILSLGTLLPFRGPVAVAISTLAAAAAFNPLRRRVQARVDRRFNRKKYSAEREIEQFAGRIRNQADLEDLGKDLVTVIQATMQPSSTSLWIAQRSPDKG